MIDQNHLQKVRDAFQSILRADYIAISNIEELRVLDEYYVDFLNNLPQVLQNQDSYINGRRGTGKTTLLMRAYYECLKTVSPLVNKQSEILGSKKVLPIYIDLSKCKEIFDDLDDISIERNFILKIVEDIQTQLQDIFDASKLKVLKKDYSKIGCFEDIFKSLQEGITIKSNKTNISCESTIEDVDKFSVSASIKDSLSANIDESFSDTKSLKYDMKELKGFNAQSLLNGLGYIRKTSKIDAIYVFVDEFSDLSDEEQIKFSSLLKKLLGSKNNIFFKVGTITDRYNFGDSIIIGRDIYPILLDLSDFVDRYGGIVAATRELNRYTDELIRKRLNTFDSEIEIDNVFSGAFSQITERISVEAMGVPRTIGMILQKALAQAETRKEVVIQISDVNVGIRETRKIYFMQFQGAIQKKALPGYYMDMWNSLLERALSEKNKNGSRPASHFMIDPIRKKYFNVFCENFIVHCLEDSRASKYGGNYVLFAIDYDICIDNNIVYASEKDQFTAARFIYDSVFQKYDCYFLKESIKSYRCPKCKKIYEESEVALAKVKRCFECDEKLEEIIHQTVPITDGNYTEVEIKILGMIGSLNESEAMSASEIGDAVGCSYQKVAAWCGRALKRKGVINVKRIDGKNYYYDS